MSFIVKNTTIIAPSELIAPHSCRGCGRIGTPLCNCCKNNIVFEHQNICPNCKSENLTGFCTKCSNLPPIFTIAERSTIVGALIHDLKYTSAKSLSKPLAELIDILLPTIIGKVLIVPLPTINRHIRERGLDHTLLIARQLTKLRKEWNITKALIRAQNSVQVGASESSRQSQAKKAYKVNPKTTIDPKSTYILLDDVWTTGASMKAAYKLIKSAGAKKIVLLPLTISKLKY